MTFELKTEYIELIKLLKIMGIAETGGHAKQLVEGEEVLYNGAVDTRKRLKVRKGDCIEVNEISIDVV